jgi:hypothetical protein
MYRSSPLVWSILAIADPLGGGLCGDPSVTSFRTLRGEIASDKTKRKEDVGP